MKRKRLGEVLQERGKISHADLNKVIQEQQGKVIFLGELLLERGLVDHKDLASALEEVAHVPYVDAATVEIEPDVLKMIPQAVAKRFCVLPVRRDGVRLVTIMAEPQNLGTIDELRFTSGASISPRMGFRSEIFAAIDKHYGRGGASAPEPPKPARAREPVHRLDEDAVLPEMEFVSTSARQANQDAISEVQAELKSKRTPAVRLVSQIILGAMQKRASDIHIEPQATETLVRIRVDGVLRELDRVPRNVQNQLISRIKILADMDISERRAPQDGRFMVIVGPRRLDLRVSSLPTQYGEKIVLRLLDTNAPMQSLSDLGLPGPVATQLESLLRAPQGMLLVTGPTGSGKSTTLYAALNLLRDIAVNIVTVEDPVEYVLDGINQVHVNVRANLTFASSLRSILRQDPNIIMVGEIRDSETAEIAMKAAQTGHLVLSTLHTNDSVAAVVRLLDLEIPGYLIAASVTGVLAQRLVRKLCACHVTQPPGPEMAARLAAVGRYDAIEKVGVPVGCPDCDQTGYRGRVGIYELLVLDETIRDMVRGEGRVDQIRDVARAHGLRLMQEDALDKVRDCITTLDEVLRAVPFEHSAALDCEKCGQKIVSGCRFCPNCGSPCLQKTKPRQFRELETAPEGILQR
ncbi:MAG: ATPase, T2SS/T4P/T4SS family [Candidatus Acidiferrales bacterium]|jgi:type IV pilus assembly protein PilB